MEEEFIKSDQKYKSIKNLKTYTYCPVMCWCC